MCSICHPACADSEGLQASSACLIRSMLQDCRASSKQPAQRTGGGEFLCSLVTCLDEEQAVGPQGVSSHSNSPTVWEHRLQPTNEKSLNTPKVADASEHMYD